ncbi:uncharacterized protein N7500_000741 [Penicillium coprophilum]|uniref:uncharacterized protein n=1 Tax=Penicillium coprophilum TaxID=36646 RepID=UPI0023A3E9E4|nr:uncharacterized protein N7500_000741 [Penicillium coprophilum]KAJ5178042.1 hypothetical protein N7500_000741 [Penicillium coprophilum]
MLSKILIASAATLAALSGLANAQTNITEKACAATSEYSKCNRDVADKWSSCLRGCNGNGNCAVDCGCESHQKSTPANTSSSSSSTSPSAPAPKNQSPSGPPPDNAPNRCSCDIGKITKTTLSSRNQQIKCMRDVTDKLDKDIDNIQDLSKLKDGLDIADRASDCACCGASASISASWDICPHTEPNLAGADMWGVFFPSDQPNLYNSLPNWAWSSCDDTLKDTKCKDLGFTDTDKFYRPGDLPKNGTSTLHEVGGTVTAPPSGTVLVWSQSSTTYTVTATGYDRKAVASQSEYRATATGSDAAFATQTSDSGAAAVRNGGVGAVVAAVFAVLVL